MYVYVLKASGYSGLLSYIWILQLLVLLIPIIFLHELCHYVFQWRFSHRRPGLHFKFSYSYSTLTPNSRVTRNQGVFCAFAPFLFVTILLVFLSFFVGFLPKELFLAGTSIHAALCCRDFFLIRWLLKHPKQLNLGHIGLSNVLFLKTQDE